MRKRRFTPTLAAAWGPRLRGEYVLGGVLERALRVHHHRAQATARVRAGVPTVLPASPLPQVRVKGEEVYDTRAILIDTTPPVTTISNTTLDLSAGFTSSDTAGFSFYATDEGTSTRFFCTLSSTNAAGTSNLGMLMPPDPDNPGAGMRVQAITSGQQFNCSSPAQLVGLSFGDYIFQVRVVGSSKAPELRTA